MTLSEELREFADALDKGSSYRIQTYGKPFMWKSGEKSPYGACAITSAYEGKFHRLEEMTLSEKRHILSTAKILWKFMEIYPNLAECRTALRDNRKTLKLNVLEQVVRLNDRGIDRKEISQMLRHMADKKENAAGKGAGVR